MSIQHFKNLNHFRLLFSRPGLVLSKVEKKINAFNRGFFIDEATRAFINHNKKVWHGWASTNSSKIILFDFHNLPQTNIAHSYFLNILAKKKDARIVSFGRDEFRFVRSGHTLYRSINVSEHLVTCISDDQKKKRDFIFADIEKNIKSKEDVFNISVNGIQIGMDIYETYLREFNKPTVLLDRELFAVIRYAIGLLVFWQDFLDKHEVPAIVLSHDCYVDFNILARVAYQRKIPVYTPDYFGTTLGLHPHSPSSRIREYKFLFEAMTDAEKKQAIELAKNQLEGNSTTKPLDQSVGRVLRTSNKLKVLICSHCFYDNPHAYGGMIFLDFYEWLKYLVGIAKKTDYDWYIKVHPDYLPGTIEIIQEIIGESSPITIIPHNTLHTQLAQEGLNVVLTVYGTVGKEYPALGVQVLNAGFNPHASFDFTWTPLSLREYEEYLLNLLKLKKNINKEEIYKFYFMHYYYFRNDNLIFDSYLQMLADLTDQEKNSSKVYTYFLKTWDLAKHERIIERFSHFIDSGKEYLSTKGPVNKRMPYIKEDGYLS